MITTILAVLAAAPLQSIPASVPQGVEYRIEAVLDETTDILHGRARLRYTNNAEVALDTLWFHQHLNAFRPQSAWARRELEFDVRRFEDLGPEDHAFERFRTILVDGAEVHAVYPLSPDSTVAAVPLPDPLRPGETVIITMDWDARLATTPRRQGRSGRHYDFAQWYPRIAVYDGGWHWQPLLPQGEFYGEFGRYDVTLEVLDDQVIGATGVPVEGDPGWASAMAPGSAEPMMQENFYGTPQPDPLGFLDERVPSGRKRIRWIAEDVHHFGWSANPDFVYEGGRLDRSGPGGGQIGIHILYWPTDADWANGAALERTIQALDWLQQTFGRYHWPQLTNLHRIESGGTEFPMMMMNGSPGEGLIVHEGTHQYLHGMLANNEFAAGWLDEGFTSFITNWYWEDQGQTDIWAPSLNSIISYERAGMAEPIGLPGAEFRDPNSYSAMTYTKASLVFRMLRWMIGENAMRQVLREFHDRHALSRIDEADFREVVNDVSGDDFDWFFDQWIHSTDQLDYAVTSAVATQAADGGWVTRVEVRRSGEAWMPVTLRAGDVEQRLSSRDRVQIVEVRTGSRPDRVILDPDGVLIDIDPTNNVAVVR